MRTRNIAGAALALALVALIVVVVAIFIVPRSMDGSASAPAPILAEKDLSTMAGGLASQPGAKYTGSVSSNRDKINLTEIVVSAAGDLSGTIKVGGESAEIIGVAGQTYAKGSAGFWKGQLGDTPKVNYEAVAAGWATLDPSTFPDLGRLLAPANLAGALAGDNQFRDMDAKGSATGLVGTPDSRFLPTGLPAMVAEENDVVAVGGALRITPSGDAGVSAVSGPIATVGGGSGEGKTVDVDLEVQDVGPTEVGRLYSTIGEQAATLTHVPAPYLRPNFDDSGFRLTVSPCSPPVCEYIVSYVAATPGAGAGSITVVGEMTLTLNGRPIGGTCAHTVTVALNGRAETRCPFTVPNEDGTLKGDVTYVFTTFVDQDWAVLERTLTANRQAATAESAGTWVRAGFKGDARARDYNTQITGVPSTFTYDVGDYAFDGRAPDGTLLMAFATGYAEYIDSDGLLSNDWDGTETLVADAEKQLEAAGSSPVRWVFAEPEAADAAAETLRTHGIRDIETVSVPPW
jgi:hypothetical protein